jgi:hypothetical protein
MGIGALAEIITRVLRLMRKELPQSNPTAAGRQYSGKA